MFFQTVHRYPFLRIFPLFAIGIFTGDLLYFQQTYNLYIVAATFLLCLTLLCSSNFIFKRYHFRWLFGMCLYIGILSGGILLSHYNLEKTYTTFPTNYSIYQIKVSSTPQIKKRSIQIKAKILSLIQNHKNQPIKATVFLYFPKENSIINCKRGDIYLISTRITFPQDYGNPDSFDYSKYLHRNNISGVGYVYRNHWKFIKHSAASSFTDYALNCREHILSLYRSFKWDKDVFSIVSALTVGYKEELTPDIKELYSIAGASHVLALSGLHIGFLYVLLLFFMKPLGKNKHLNILRSVIIILLLWAFAFFTGLSPSVIRSVIMFSLFSIAKCLERENFSINTLSAAAFFMLLYSPEWLFDIGFQLSFCAVASLLLFNPYIDSLIRPHTWIGKKSWQLTSVSISAQLGTAPLVAYYFYRFSVYFILSGLVVIPFASIIMYVSVFLLICTPIPSIQILIASLLQKIVQLLNILLNCIIELPYSSIDGIFLHSFEIVLIYATLIFFIFFLKSNKAKRMIYTLCCMIALITIHFYYLTESKSSNYIQFYNIRACPSVHCIACNRQSWLVCPNQHTDIDEIQKKMIRHWNRLHLEKPQIIIDSYHNKHLITQSGIISFNGIRIAMISDNRWRYQRANSVMNLDYLYICRGYRGKLEELFSMFKTRRIILDSSLSKWQQENYAKACYNSHIPCIPLIRGSYKVEL